MNRQKKLTRSRGILMCCSTIWRSACAIAVLTCCLHVERCYSDEVNIEQVLKSLDEAESKLKSFQVKCDVTEERFSKRLGELESSVQFGSFALATALDGRIRCDSTLLQSVNPKLTHRISVFDGLMVRHKLNFGGPASEILNENGPSNAYFHGIQPRDFVSHFHDDSLASLLRTSGVESIENDSWNGHKVLKVCSLASVNSEREWGTCVYLAIDHDFTVVKVANVVRFSGDGEHSDWIEYAVREVKSTGET